MVGTAATKVERAWPWAFRRLGSAIAGACLFAVAGGPAAAQSAGILDRIQESAEIRLAYRPDAAPFSYELDGKPGGYSVNLCLEVADALQDDLNLPNLTARFVLGMDVRPTFEAQPGSEKPPEVKF